VRFCFENLVLDAGRRELLRDGAPVAVEPQVFDLLLYLVENRDRVVSKDDVLNAVWHGRIVSESTLTTRINAARKALGDSGEVQRLIRTLPRKGLRFVGEVQHDPAPSAGEPFWAAPAPALVLPERPSIAVMPLRNLGGDPEQEYFADGLAEEIIAALSRFKSLLVVAGESSFFFKGKQIDVGGAAEALGVRYLLDGSVQRAGGRVRIAAHLVECPGGTHLWADRFEGTLADVFDLQDRVTTGVVGAIVPALDEAEMARARRKPVGNLTAWDCYLRGLALTRILTREAVAGALRLFYRASELDPDFATPCGLIALSYVRRRNKGWSTASLAEDEAEVRRLAAVVAARGSDDALALCTAGYALVQMCGEFEVGSVMIDRGLALNRNLPWGWRTRGWASLVRGHHEAALEQFAHSLQLSPLDPENFHAERGMAAALLHLERYDEAVPWADRALARQPDDVASMRTAAAVNAMAGRRDAAHRIMADILRAHSGMRISLLLPSVVGLHRPEDHARLIDGLRRAGMPE
jgi:TolB-like protein